MRAFGATNHLKLSDIASIQEFSLPKPTATGHDLLVQIQAIAINPVDVYDRGKSPDHTPKITGWDATGQVVSVGSAVTLFQPGDTVYYAGAYDRPGCDAEFQLVDERLVGAAPTTLTPAQAAALPLTTLTAWEALFEQLGIDRQTPLANHGQTILIINGAGGVGSMATQLAHLAGLTVIATASRPATQQWCRDHGADYTVDHHHDLVPQVQALGYPTVDYILELHNLNRHWKSITTLIKPGGHVASITGSSQPIALTDLKAKRVHFAWEWMYAKSFYQTADMISQHQILTQAAHLVDTGQLVSTLNQTLSPINAENMRQAQQLVARHHAIGKIVVAGW